MDRGHARADTARDSKIAQPLSTEITCLRTSACPRLAGLGDIDVPTLGIGADRDATTPWDTVVEPSNRELTTTPRALAELTDAGHFSFTDFCTAVNADDGCSDDFRPFEDVLATTRTSALAFLRSVQGDERAQEWLPPDEGVSSWESSDL